MEILTKLKLQYLLASSLGRFCKKNKGLRIITYHSICTSLNKVAHVSPELFEKHLRYLVSQGYKSYRVCDLVVGNKDLFDDHKAIFITFDDGLYNNYSVALPLLQKYNLKATFFVPTAYVSDKRLVLSANEMLAYKGFKMMSWSDLHKMVYEGFEIGAHSHSHVMVGQRDYKAAAKEIEMPKKILEENLKIKIISFAYPKGQRASFSQATRKMIYEFGYKTACTMLENFVYKDTDLLSLPRIGITGMDNLNRFRMKLEGFYDCLNWLRKFH